jgi:hypothetical protein
MDPGPSVIFCGRRGPAAFRTAIDRPCVPTGKALQPMREVPMSVVSSPRRWAPLALLGLILGLSLAGILGCGEKEVDPYVYADLRAVMDGDTLSNNFLFEIDTPRFEYVRGNTAVVREGNRLEFLVGPDLEENYTRYQGALLGVQKFFKPTPHLVIQRVKRQGVIDTLPPVTNYVIPKVMRASAVDLQTPGADLPSLRWDRKQEYATYLPDEDGNEKPIQTGITKFVYAPKYTLPDSVRANPSEKDMAWYAVFPEATLQIVDLTPGADYMLHLLQDKDLPLVGSFTVLKLEDSYLERKKTYGDLGHVIGEMKINWFRYANSFIAGSATEA